MQDLLSTFSSFFISPSRLYRLEAEQAESEAASLLVESWSLRETLSHPWELQVSTLSTCATLDIHALLGQRITLHTKLADGHTEHPRSGLITEATAIASDGGFARYLLTVQPWLALLAYGARSAVWQEKTVVEIVDSVFGAYDLHAAWTWNPCAQQHLNASHQGGLRSYTVQYRETDLAFVSRVLAREGLVYRFERDDDAPLGHRLVILADTTQVASCPEDTTSARAGGVRFHRASSQEQQDAVQVLGGLRELQAASSSVLVWDYKTKGGVAAEAPTVSAFAGPNAPRIGQYRPGLIYGYASAADAERAMVLSQQALEARHKTWLGRSTVRTFTAGQQFQLTNSPLDALALFHRLAPHPHPSTKSAAEQSHFLLTSVIHAGINNLPKDLHARILKDPALRVPGPWGEAVDPTHAAQPLQPPLAAWVSEEVRTRAVLNGYGNGFEAIRSDVPWRVALFDADGAPLYPTPRPGGPLTATVVGPDGATSGQGAQEIHTDRLGRIRIRFDFQSSDAHSQHEQTSHSSTWVRVLQRFAGPGMGWQFTPRLGQEVLVDFADGVVERPVVIATLYNGRGEAGAAPSPGGKGATSDTSALATSQDHRPGAQGNLIGTGHSPAWHGAGGLAATPGAAGQNNASALNGIKTKEFGGWGYNQLVFDDSAGQLRVQLATSQHSTQLNLGHLIHQADNHRGSLRGAGFELRTDAYGAVRAGSGVLLTTYGPAGTGGTDTGAATREPAGDNAAGIALAAQLNNLGQSLHQAAQIHQTTTLAAAQPQPEATEPQLQAWHTSLKGMVNAASFEAARADAAQKHTGTQEGNIPASADPLIALHARAGWAASAGQDVQLSAADNITLASGQDNTWATGGSYRLHTGQSLGVLAGAVQPGTEAAGTGITLIAGEGDTQIQAQSDTLQIAAKDQVSIQSEAAHIDWAAAKKITLQTAGGARIVIEGGNITFECPGTITVQATAKAFEGPERVGYPMPTMPRASCKSCLIDAMRQGAPGVIV